MQLSVTISLDAAPEAIWPYLVDFDHRHQWETDLEALIYDADPATGVTGLMELANMPPMPFELAKFVPNQSFWDKTALPGAGFVVFKHDISVEGGVTLLTQSVELDKPGFGASDVDFLSGVFADSPAAMWRLKAIIEL